MVLTERLRVLPDGRLEDRITIDDPETFTQPWETVLYFRRDAAARVTDDICPDRIADGEPAVRKELPAPAALSATPAAASTPADAAAATPRLGGIWEPRTFGFMVPEAPLSTAGKALVDRNVAAMTGGSIMHTAWVSCRPGAVSTMTMPREKIVVLQSPEELTILYEMPRMTRRVRMNGTHPQNLPPSYVGDSIGRWEGDTLVIDTVGFNGYAELDSRGQPTSAALHTVERLTPAADGSGIDIEVTIDGPRVLRRPVHDQTSVEQKLCRTPARIRLHGKSAAGRLRERLLRARPLPADVHAGEGRRCGAVTGGLSPSGGIVVRVARKLPAQRP